MDDKNLILIRTMVDATISNYFWWFIIAGAAVFFKNVVESIVSGLIFYWGRDYNVDDEVYLCNGTKRARIVRQTLSKTTFYIYGANRRLVVPNHALPSMLIETVLRTEPKQQQDLL